MILIMMNIQLEKERKTLNCQEDRILMGYFRELLEIDYFISSDSDSSSNYLRVKIFSEGKLVMTYRTFLPFLAIRNCRGARPDTVAEEIYGDAELIGSF